MIGQRTWPSDTNKISDWPNTNEISENTWLIGTKLCNLCMSSTKIPHFVLIRWSVWSMVFNTTFSNISVSVLCPSCLCLRQRDELPCGGCDNCFEGLNYPQCERGQPAPWIVTVIVVALVKNQVLVWDMCEGGKVKPCCGRKIVTQNSDPILVHVTQK